MSETAKCKACKRGGDDVTYLFGLSKKVFICDGCVEMCRDIMGAKRYGQHIASYNLRASQPERATE